MRGNGNEMRKTVLCFTLCLKSVRTTHETKNSGFEKQIKDGKKERGLR